MARPPKNGAPPHGLLAWAEELGAAIGRGIARGLNAAPKRGRGRPPKPQVGGPAPPDRRCRAEGCTREARSKGLCSQHYQAQRRRQLARSSP